MQVNIIAVGKIKEKYLSDAIKEYSKRLGAYVRLNIIEVPDEKAPENLHEADAVRVKEKEGANILKNIKDSDYVITLEIKGEMVTSEGLAEKIDGLGLSGRSTVDFVIGGSLGLSDEVCRRSDYALSFSKMTFPHQLMRVILLEQIYRSFKIIKHEPYHK